MFSNTAVLGAALWAVSASGPGFVSANSVEQAVVEAATDQIAPGFVSANPVEQAVVEAATDPIAPEIIFAPAGHHRVIPDSKESLSLMREDSFYWAHDGEELIANMTITAHPHVRLLNEHNFVDLVHSVDCSSAQQIKLFFKSTYTVAHARDAWSSWLATSTSNTSTDTDTTTDTNTTTTTNTNTLIFVTDSQGCGGQHGRQPYHVRDVTYDDAGGAAHLHVHAEARWADFVEDATVTIGEPPSGQQSRPSPEREDDDDDSQPRPSGHDSNRAVEEHEMQRRHWSYAKKLNISLDHNFTRPLYHSAHLSLDCADCALHGALATDISVSTQHGLSASALTADDLHVRLLLALSASGPLVPTSRLSRTSLNITRLAPLGVFKIADIVRLAPLLDLVMAVEVGDVRAALDLAAGVELGFADGQSIDIGHHHVGATTRLDPVFRRIGPTVKGEVDATARFEPLLTLHISGSILGKHVTGGVGLAAPNIALAVGADVGGPNPCTANATSTVHFSVNVGVEVDSFYGFGNSGDEPNKHSVFKKDHPLLNECIAISH